MSDECTYSGQALTLVFLHLTRDDPMQLCAVEEESQRSCYPELEHMSAVKRDHRGLLLGPAGRCQSPLIDQRSLFRVRPYILLMSLRRVRGLAGSVPKLILLL